MSTNVQQTLMTDDPTSLASLYLDGELDAGERARVESTPELLTEVERLRQVRAVLAELPEASISARERHLANAFDAWERLPEQERTGALRDGTPAGVDGAAVAGAAAVSRSRPSSSRRRGRRGVHSSVWLGAAAAGLVIVLAGGLLIRSANTDSNDDSVAESSDAAAADQLPSADPATPAAAAADTIAESEIERASAGGTEAAPSENASDVDTNLAADAPPSDNGDLAVLLTTADLADFAAAAIDAPASGKLPDDATVITDAPAEVATAASALSDEAPLPKCLGADIVVGLANYQGQTVVVGLDVSRDLALAYIADGCVRVASAPLP